jgi:hypothetical protein
MWTPRRRPPGIPVPAPQKEAWLLAERSPLLSVRAHSFNHRAGTRGLCCLSSTKSQARWEFAMSRHGSGLASRSMISLREFRQGSIGRCD